MSDKRARLGLLEIGAAALFGLACGGGGGGHGHTASLSDYVAAVKSTMLCGALVTSFTVP